jgi:hypothetical protein
MDFFAQRQPELPSSISVPSAFRSSEADTTGKTKADRQTVNTKARERLALSVNLDARQQAPSATSASPSQRRLRSSSIAI